MKTRVNLYHNCILNSRYTEVFRNKELLDTYLATLTKPYITNIEIENVYTTLSGTIYIDSAPFSTDFNYIKFEELDDSNNVKQTCYAFIDKFRIVNDLIVIDYTQDIWHTYIDKWSLRTSYVTNSYRTIIGEPYEKILPFINNGKISIEKLPLQTVVDLSTIPNGEFLYGIVVKAQLYQLVSGGNTQQIIFEGYFGYRGDVAVPTLDSGLIKTTNDVSLLLDKIAFSQATNLWTFTGAGYSESGIYCSFSEIYVLPAKWIEILGAFVSEPKLLYGGTNYMQFTPIPTLTSTVEMYSHTIEANDKILSIGLFSRQIPYIYDGINKRISIMLMCTMDTFGVYLSINGNMIDITKEFFTVQDYNVVTPDVLVQREIARKQQTINGICGIINGVTQIGIGAAQMGVGLPSIPYTTAKSPLDEFGVPITSTMSKSPVSTAQGIGNIAGGITGIVSSISNIAFANKEKYTTFTTANNDTNFLINAYYGICILKMENIVNENESNYVTKECGYKVNYITDNLDIDNNSTTAFNTIKFGFTRIVGLSNEICNAIATILENGVKIWYNSTLTET